MADAENAGVVGVAGEIVRTLACIGYGSGYMGLLCSRLH